jgi:hypothetical protein
MNKLLLLLFLFICSEIKAQVIHGQILESGTNKPVPRASIYFNGTFLVTISDNDGNFTLKAAVSNKIPIIVSSIGYATETVSAYSIDEPLKIYLNPKNYILKTVLIGDDGMSLKEKIRIFKKEFLGTSANAKNCIIENMDDVELSYDSRTKVLTAAADKPLVIYNRKLGYKVNCFISGFTYTAFSTSFQGNQLFEEDTFLKEAAGDEIRKQREDTYLGSRMHFIRALWNNELEKNNFRVYNMDRRKLDYNDIIVINNDQKYIYLGDRLVVMYKHRQSSISPFMSRYSYTYIEKNGFFDSSQISWRGDMGDQRVGDQLPFEYPGN